MSGMLEGQVAIVTGGSKGIGGAIVRAFARAGADASAEASLGLVTAKPAEAREERTANDAPRAAAAARGPRRRRRPASGGSRGGAGARSSGRRGGGPAGAGKPSGPVTPRQIAFRKRMGVSAPAVPTRALTRPMLPRPDRPPWKERPRP